MIFTAGLASAREQLKELHDHAENLHSYHRAFYGSDIFFRVQHSFGHGLNFCHA